MIIGVAGYARSGKDAVADLLGDHGFVRLAFADKLRQVLYATNPLVRQHVRVQDVVDKLGWDEAKTQYPEVRLLLQRLGTEGGRQVLGDDIWVQSTLMQIEPGRSYVITDVRFPNEANAIRRRSDGYVVWIDRPGVGPLNDHASENSLNDYDFDALIVNDGTLDDLRDKLRTVFRL